MAVSLLPRASIVYDYQSKLLGTSGTMTPSDLNRPSKAKTEAGAGESTGNILPSDIRNDQKGRRE